MNPLYQYDENLRTVITVDILCEKSLKREFASHEDVSLKWLQSVRKLVTKHQQRFNNI